MTYSYRRLKSCLFVMAALILSGTAAPAFGDFFFFTDRLGYVGTVTVYDTLADAQAGTNSLSGPHANPERDLTLFFNDDSPFHASDASIFQTAWYYTTDPGSPPNSGVGNPNNTNTGYIQFYDLMAVTNQSVTGQWSTLNLGTPGASAFTMTASGFNAAQADVTGRLWHAPNVGGSGALTAADFVEWELSVTVGGLTAIQDGGYYTSSDQPTSASGYLRGIAENVNTLDPSLNKFYVFDYAITLDSWAWDNRDDIVGGFNDSFFAAAVPEPGSALLFAVAGVGIGIARRRRG